MRYFAPATQQHRFDICVLDMLTRALLGYSLTLRAAGGGAFRPPELSRERVVVARQARRRSKDLDETLLKRP